MFTLKKKHFTVHLIHCAIYSKTYIDTLHTNYIYTYFFTQFLIQELYNCTLFASRAIETSHVTLLVMFKLLQYYLFADGYHMVI